MKKIDRRRFIGGAAAMSLIPAAASAQAEKTSKNFEKIDAMANSAIYYMIQNFPATRDMVEQSAGFLMIPLVTQGALLFGAAAGKGVLRVKGETVEYYQSLQFNVGIQVSANQYSQAVFFLNENALNRFRQSQGWKFGAGMRYVMIENTAAASMDTLTRTADVAGLTFAESGLHLGMSLEGTKFSPIGK